MPNPDELAGIDSLIPAPPKVEAPDPFDLPTRTPEEAAAALAEVHARTEKAKEAEKEVTDAAEALVAAVEAWRVSPTADARDAVYAAALAAEALGVVVNRGELHETGAVPPDAWAEPEIDIDAAPEPEPEPEPEPVEAAPPADPMILVPEMIPVYNPMPMATELRWAGRAWRLSPNSVSLVHVDAVVGELGLDNTGGLGAFRMGVRRLYGPEPRFVEVAEKAGMPIEQWCERRNTAVKLLADAAWKKVEAEVMGNMPTSEEFGFKK